MSPQLAPESHLEEAVSRIETCLKTLKTELETLETRLDQTRGEYWRVQRYLESIKAQLPRQNSLTVAPFPHGEEVDLTTYIDADWEHLMKQLNSM
jgi:hypothetical protein